MRSKEPANHVALVDRDGDTWIRVDEVPGRYGRWWPICDGPGWGRWARGAVGTARTWKELQEHRPFTVADRRRTALALARIHQEAGR